MTTDNIVLLDKKPSEEILELANRLASAMINTAKQRRINKELTQKILEKGRSEGLSDKTIRNLIEEALRSKGVTERTIKRYIPSEIKNPKMIRVHYIKNVKLPDMPPKSVMFLGNVEPLVNIPHKLYAPLKTRLLTAMRDKLDLKFTFKDGEVTEIV